MLCRYFFLFAKDKQLIDDLFASLKDDFLCTDEGETDGHLGVEIKTENEQMTLKQPQLTKRTIKLLGSKYSNPKATSVVKSLISKHANGKEKSDESFQYRSVLVHYHI